MMYQQKIINAFKILTEKHVVESDYRLNKLLPTHPLFHATSFAVPILVDNEGIRSDKGSRWWKKNDKAICLTRDISWLLDGKFGNTILVLDREQLKTRFKIEPVDPLAYMSGFQIRKGEKEERIYTDCIPAKYIKAMIVLVKPHKKMGIVEFKESPWPQTLKYIYLDPNNKEITVY